MNHLLKFFLEGSDPFFKDFSNQEFRPKENSQTIDSGGPIPVILLPDYNAIKEYVKHIKFTDRPLSGILDIGAYEYEATVSIYHQVNANSFYTYPNPVGKSLYISSETSEYSQYQIVDITGKIITSNILKTQQINVSDIPRGLYVLKLNNGNSIAISQFIKL